MSPTVLLVLQIGCGIGSFCAIALSALIIVALLRGDDKRYREQYKANLLKRWEEEAKK